MKGNLPVLLVLFAASAAGIAFAAESGQVAQSGPAGGPAAGAAQPAAPAGPGEPALEPKDVRPLVESIVGSDEQAKKAALERISRLGDAAVAPLVKMLQDPQVPASVRQLAADALVAVGRSALDPLLLAAGKGDVSCRALAVQALGRLGDRAATRGIMRAFEDREAEVRRSAAEAIGRLADPDGGLAVVYAFQHDTSVDVRVAAAEAMGRLAIRVAVEPLVEGLKDASPRVRLAAANALATMGEMLASGVRGELGRVRAADGLIGALADPDASVRSAAAGALGVMREGRAVEPLTGLLADAEVRLDAIKALGRIGGRDAMAALLKLVETSPDQTVRLAAREALAAMPKRR